MAIFDKPFLFTEMLRKTIYKGRPNFFNAKDLNKGLEIIQSFVEETNKSFVVESDIQFTVSSFSESFNGSTDEWTRVITTSWGATTVLYRGVKFTVASGTISAHQHVYDKPDETVSPREVKPPSYIVLKAELSTITYADNPALCGIQSDEVPASVPSVDVEQYSNVRVEIVSDPSTESDLICILGTIHPKYNDAGEEDSFGFMYHTFNGKDASIINGTDRENSTIKTNKTLLENLTSKLLIKLNKIADERQLIFRFNLADAPDKAKLRKNIGLSNLTNNLQLVRSAALSDLTDKPKARLNLGLKNSAEKKVGYGSDDVAPGTIVPIGGIIIWSGAVNAIPDGWRLCNGQNGTPNLSERFLVGYSPTNTDYDVVGKLGGAKEVTLTEAQMPSHTHSQQGSGTYARKHGSDGNVVAQATGTTGSKGGDQPHENRPPYYVVCYIQFVGITTILNYSEPAAPTNAAITDNFSSPDSDSDGGHSDYVYTGIGASEGVSEVGSGITITNP